MNKKAVSQPKIVLILTMFFSLIVFPGCNFLGTEPYKTVDVYDLGIPKNICPESTILNIFSFKNDSGCKTKMLYRTEKTKILLDDYNKWNETPSAMLTSYLQIAFNNDVDSSGQKEDTFSLHGSVVVFEIDIDKKEALLGVVYQISDKKGKVLIKKGRGFKRKFTKVDSLQFANAMSGAASDFAAKIRAEIIELKKAK